MRKRSDAMAVGSSLPQRPDLGKEIDSTDPSVLHDIPSQVEHIELPVQVIRVAVPQLIHEARKAIRAANSEIAVDIAEGFTEGWALG